VQFGYAGSLQHPPSEQRGTLQKGGSVVVVGVVGGRMPQACNPALLHRLSTCLLQAFGRRRVLATQLEMVVPQNRWQSARKPASASVGSASITATTANRLCMNLSLLEDNVLLAISIARRARRTQTICSPIDTSSSYRTTPATPSVKA